MWYTPTEMLAHVWSLGTCVGGGGGRWAWAWAVESDEAARVEGGEGDHESRAGSKEARTFCCPWALEPQQWALLMLSVVTPHEWNLPL